MLKLKIFILGAFVALTLPLSAAEYKNIEIVTNLGTMKLKLFQEKFPITVDNFLKYVAAGYYKNTLFYRLVPDFVIQGGNVDLKYEEKEDLFPAIKNEACNDPSIKNTRGTIAMARYEDINSATSAFYINLKHNTNLDCDAYKYTVFGEITEGLDIMQKIGDEPTRVFRDFQNLPVNDVIIQEIKLL